MLLALLITLIAAPPEPPSTTMVLERALPDRTLNRTLSCSRHKPSVLVTTAEARAGATTDTDKLWCSVLALEVALAPRTPDQKPQPARCRVSGRSVPDVVELAPTADGKGWQTVKPYQTKCGLVTAVYAPAPGGKFGTWRLVEELEAHPLGSPGCVAKETAEFLSERRARPLKCDEVDLCGSCAL